MRVIILIITMIVVIESRLEIVIRFSFGDINRKIFIAKKFYITWVG